jgi:hypothetical protein
MFAQVDAEGNRHVLFDEIIDHRCDGTENELKLSVFSRYSIAPLLLAPNKSINVLKPLWTISF